MRTKPLMLAIALGLGLAMPGLQARPAPEAPQTQVQDLPLWLVVFDEPGAAAFRGFPASDRLRPALAATSPAATGARKYDAASPEARSYLGYLDELRRLRLGDAAAAVGRPLQAHYVYRHALNAVAVRISAEEAAVIAGLPGIRAVRPDFAYAPESDRSAAWVNADDVWNGNVPGVPARRGAGAIVGVVDGGINRSHTAFSGAGITNPRGAGNFLGWCSTNPSACNGKVIGLYDFIASGTGMADPSADASHGTHVASIAVGAQWLTYSGIAPDASLVHYRGCCTSTALLKSIDQGVADGVDVITMSIGGEQLQDPWTGVASAGYYDDAEAFLAAREAGIVVVKSAGNQGAGAGTITYPGNSPWMIAVAAASHDRYGTANGDRIATWSSRGPSVPFGVIKPDITAPGVDIDAAGTSGLASVARMSGTSMAAPQVAGAAAVLISIDPSRTPDQVVSALMLTARPTAKTGPITAADPHTRGAGVLDVARAARAGLYLAVPPNAFRNARANDWTGGAQNLNLPSLSHAACFRSCSLTRTFTRMPGSPASTYNVSVTMEDPQATLTPSLTSFVASNGGTAITFSIDVDDPALVDRWLYGTVTLTSTAGDGSPELRLPVAIYASPFSSEAAAAALAPIARTVDSERGFFDIDVSGMVPFTDARFATTDLVAPVVTTQTIPADPTTNPYDNPAQNYVRLVPVPIDASGAPFLVEASTSAANPDIDLYVGFDTNGNGLPDAGEELCDSISTGSNESCTVELTTGATAGNVWVMVQNYSGPGTNVTVRTLGLSTVASDAPTLVATGPGRVPEGAPFKLRVAWDDPGFVAGAERYGYLITRTAAGGNPIFTRLRLTRSGTGVVPYALAPAAARTVFLPAGGAHDRLYFDVPPGVTKMTLRTSNGSGSVSLYAARIDQPAGPAVAAAPPRGSASHSATGAGANQTIVINNPAAGRWYVTPVNTGGG
ncbi:S8 family serine peptidase, partial [Arenimonas composti]